MAFTDWLRRKQEESARNTRLFQNRPNTLRAGEVPTHAMVPASQAWSGYQDRGEQLMVRQPIRRRSPPPTSVTLKEGDDGSRQRITKWEPEKQLKATGLRDSSAGSPLNLGPVQMSGRAQIAGQSYPGGSYGSELRGRLPAWRPPPNPALELTQQPGREFHGVDAAGNPTMPDISNQRAMYHALRRPRPQVAHIPSTRGDIGATQSIGAPNQDPRMRGMRPSIMNTGNWLDNLGERYTNWRQRMIEADRRRRQRGNY
jgi:hypothetical protein